MTLDRYLLKIYLTTDNTNDKLHTSTIFEDINSYDSFKGTTAELVAKSLIRLKIGKYHPDKITIKKERKRGFINIKRRNNNFLCHIFNKIFKPTTPRKTQGV
jgi:hypothetical protein